MSRRQKGNPVNGVVVLDKPQGFSSNDAVQKAKGLFRARKVGHTGSLDPLATGVLPLCFGEATKFSQYLLASDKKYWARIKLGVSTDSGDAEGRITATQPAQHVTAELVETELANFRGTIEQIPSMFSAIKHNGQPLYKLARQGIEVERKSRQVHIHSNELMNFAGDEIEIELHCSKGTYVRTIAEDLGTRLGCGAHVIALRRLQAGPFVIADAVSFEELQQARDEDRLQSMLQGVSSAVSDWPEVSLVDSVAYYIQQGQPVLVPHAPSSGWVRLSAQVDGEQDRFLGVGEVLDDGRVAPRRLLSNG